MSKPKAVAIHYQPPDYPHGHFACSVNWANGIEGRWTANVLHVTCKNCQRSKVMAMYMAGYLERASRKLAQLEHEAIAKHITGRPVRHPHIINARSWIGLNRVDGRLDFSMAIVVMGHSVESDR